MRKALFCAVGCGLLGLAFLFLLSCVSPKATEITPQHNDIGPLTTIGLFPITYEKEYPPPMPSDIQGADLSKMITRHVESVLSKKGYKVKKVDFPTELAREAPFISMQAKPSALVGNSASDLDRFIQVHVNSYSGIVEMDRSEAGDSFEHISLHGTARLIDKNGPKEIWRNKGRAEPLGSLNFSNRLNFATDSLASSLFEKFPQK